MEILYYNVEGVEAWAEESFVAFMCVQQYADHKRLTKSQLEEFQAEMTGKNAGVITGGQGCTAYVDDLAEAKNRLLNRGMRDIRDLCLTLGK